MLIILDTGNLLGSNGLPAWVKFGCGTDLFHAYQFAMLLEKSNRTPVVFHFNDLEILTSDFNSWDDLKDAMKKFVGHYPSDVPRYKREKRTRLDTQNPFVKRYEITKCGIEPVANIDLKDSIEDPDQRTGVCKICGTIKPLSMLMTENGYYWCTVKCQERERYDGQDPTVQKVYAESTPGNDANPFKASKLIELSNSMKAFKEYRLQVWNSSMPSAFVTHKEAHRGRLINMDKPENMSDPSPPLSPEKFYLRSTENFEGMDHLVCVVITLPQAKGTWRFSKHAIDYIITDTVITGEAVFNHYTLLAGNRRKFSTFAGSKFEFKYSNIITPTKEDPSCPNEKTAESADSTKTTTTEEPVSDTHQSST